MQMSYATSLADLDEVTISNNHNASYTSIIPNRFFDRYFATFKIIFQSNRKYIGTRSHRRFRIGIFSKIGWPAPLGTIVVFES